MKLLAAGLIVMGLSVWLPGQGYHLERDSLLRRSLHPLCLGLFWLGLGMVAGASAHGLFG